jgi:hypothetical protein
MNDLKYKSVKVFHLDDQPENVSWIPRKISEWFWKHFRKEMSQTKFMEENDEETEFKIFLEFLDEYVLVEYAIYVDNNHFIEAVRLNNGAPMLVILDQAIKNDFEAGGRAYKEIEKVADNVIVLTAYPQETCRQLNWSEKDERLVAKPPDILKVLARFFRAMSPVISQKSQTTLIKWLGDEEAS